MTENKSIASRWRIFLIENTFIRNYKVFDRLKMLPNELQLEKPYLDKSLPGLLFIKAVSMLDEFLKEYLKLSNLKLSEAFRNDLNGRIEYLKETKNLINSDELHNLRKTRNRLAHDSSELVTWGNYDNCITEIHNALLHLKIVTREPSIFSCAAERSALDTNVSDKSVFGTFTYTVIVMEGDKKAAEYKWKENILN